MRIILVFVGLLLASFLVWQGMKNAGRGSALPSWSNTSSKQAILDFVKEVTTQGGPHFVSPSERIAVFDNDGTLWCEKPVYVQAAFVFERIEALAQQHPEWKEQEPFASVLKGDLPAALAEGEKSLMKMVMATHAGMTTDEFRSLVTTWIATARHPKSGRLYTEMVYKPMLELINFLKDNGFKVYIVTGGGLEFLRPWVERVYGIPPEQVIGSSVKSAFESRDGKPSIVRLPEIGFINDKEGKPIGIQKVIGKRPIAAFGNSDGDFEMLEWTTSAPGLRLGMIVHHDDELREFAYDRKSAVGKLDKAMDAAPVRGWHIVSMKGDWKVVYPQANGRRESFAP